MCSLNFNHVGDDIMCKSIENFLLCGAFSGQKLLTRQSDKETWINE